jgi:hypothetical protein
MAQRQGPSYSVEVLWRVTLQRVAQNRGMLTIGAVLPIALALARLAIPLELRNVFDQLQLYTKVLALYYLGFSVVYLCSLWLNPKRHVEEQELAVLPLPASQELLQRILDHLLLPLLVFALSLPGYLAVLAFAGIPYGQAPENTSYLVSNNWDTWAEWHEPFAWRAFFAVLILLSSVLLPLALGILLDELIAAPLWRIPLLVGIPVGAFFLIRHVSDEYLRYSYKQYRGLSPAAFVIVFALLLITPFVLGYAGPRLRRWLGLGAALLMLFGAALPLLRYHLPGDHTTSTLRNLLGDGRYALGYFTCHLSPVLNLDLIFNSYASNLMLNNHRPHDLIPHHVAIWVGAGLYPVMIPLLAIGLYFFGAALRLGRPPQARPIPPPVPAPEQPETASGQ